jgi:hypothetical protein
VIARGDRESARGSCTDRRGKSSMSRVAMGSNAGAAPRRRASRLARRLDLDFGTP